MSVPAPLIAARKMLEGVTPLKFDCGGLCRAACCAADPDEITGMLLFPHEEELYIGQEKWMGIIPSGLMHQGKAVPLLYCTKPCPREHRPLACRIFPLVGTMRRGKLAVKMDVRGEQVCPLIDSGIKGLNPDFVTAVREVFDALSMVPEYAAYLQTLGDHLRQYRLF